MTKRRAVLSVLFVLLLTVLAACGPSAAPSAAPAAPEPAKPAEALPAAEPAKPAEAPAAAAVVDTPYGPRPADAIEYPAPPALELGNVEVKRQPISEIVTYKALSEYHEPEWVTELVTQGKLPPVQDRLPKEPQVVLTSGMATGIGVYGDVWRDFSACPTAGWNNGAGVTSGWFGIEAMSWWDQALVQTAPLFRADQDIEPFPQLAKSWEWSDDGMQLTMHLIEGAKWSDGAPFSADDVLFTWEDLILDPQVVRFGPKGDAWSWDGTQAVLEKVDEYTIRWSFPVAKPLEKFYFMDEGDFSLSPAHILKPLHPKYNTSMDYKSFADALPPDHLPQVTMGPWVAVEYKTDELMILRRNPYYWKVDEAGNQLPYIDEATFQKGPSGVGRALCTMAGGCDHANLENPASEFLEALKRAQEADAQFSINWGVENLAFGLMVNQSESLGVQDERDVAIRALFREDKFRQALSHAIDREGIAQSIMRGPFIRAWVGGLYPGAPEFDRSAAVYYGYDPDRSRTLLAELGFQDTDNNGVLNWTDGSLQGQDLVISINASQDARETMDIGDTLVAEFAQIGIRANLRPQTSQANNDLNVSGQWDMSIFRGDQTYALPFTRCNNLAPLTKQTPNWNREGETPRLLRDWEQELVDIVKQYCVERDMPTRKELINRYNYIFTLHNYNIGIVVGRYGLALAKRFQNVPSGTPVFMYDWVENSLMYEQVWTPKELQLPQVRPNTIPVYNQ